MTTGEGIALGAGALLLTGLVYVGATKLAGGADDAQAKAAAQAALERERLVLQLQAQQQAARPQAGTQAGGFLGDLVNAAPGIIDLGTKLFGAIGSR